MIDIDVKIPAALASECGGARHVRISVEAGARLADLLDLLDAAHPRLGRRLRDEAGNLRRYVNIYVGDEECRRQGGLSASIEPGQSVQILPSIAGGC